jgi:hypothetical protein
MKICQLHHLELPIFIDSGSRFLGFGRVASPNAKTSLQLLRPTIQKNGSIFDFPVWTRVDSIRTIENIDICHSTFRVTGMTGGRAPKPEAAWSGLPSPDLRLFRNIFGWRSKTTDLQVDDHLVIGSQFLLLLPLELDVGARGPARAQVEVLVDAIPVIWIQFATRKRIDRGTCGDSNIGDHVAGVMRREMAVDRGRKDTKSIIENDYHE